MPRLKKNLTNPVEEEKEVITTKKTTINKPSTKKSTVNKTTSKKKTINKTAKTKSETQPKKEEKVTQPKSTIKVEFGVPSKKDKIVPEVPYTIKEAEPVKESFIVVLTPEGSIYIEPVPRYCDFITFRNFMASFPDMPSSDNFSFKAAVSTYEAGDGELSISQFDGTRKTNPFVNCFFDFKKGFKNVGGNLVFTGKGKGLSEAESKKMFNWVVKTLQTPIEADVKGDSEKDEN